MSDVDKTGLAAKLEALKQLREAGATRVVFGAAGEVLEVELAEQPPPDESPGPVAKEPPTLWERALSQLSSRSFGDAETP
jgi:hypothetical protein